MNTALLIFVAFVTLHVAFSQSSLLIELPPGFDLAAFIAAAEAEGNGTITVSDVNECDQAESCPANSNCTNSVGTYSCACLGGFDSGGTGDNGDTSCIDVDECADTTICNGTAGSTCANSPGTYDCTCEDGFEKNADESACVDIDECADNICAAITDSTCANSDGGYSCNCGSGFEKNADETSCIDINECVDETICSGISGSVCNNSPGTSSCDCPEGFVLNEEEAACQDINECDGDTDPCADVTSSTCSNSAGGYECTCETGYELNAENTACENINECDAMVMTHDCGTNEICSDTEGSFTCQCATGYQGNPPTESCTDIDECGQDGTCDAEAVCINTNGGYECYCDTGFYGPGGPGQCIDVNSCSTFDNLKVNIAQILNTEEGDDVSAAEENLDDYNSASGKAPGVSGDAFRARYETDGVELNAHILNVIDDLRCDYFSSCSDDSGNETCTCDAGYEFVDGSTTQCQDVDECTATPCGNLATCANLEGDFDCTCPDGYKLTDGAKTANCTDIDECLNDTLNDCSNEATCVNSPGWYDCTCMSGFMGNGLECESALSCEAFNKVRASIDTMRNAAADEDTSDAETTLNYYISATGRAEGVPGDSYTAQFGVPTGLVSDAIDLLRCDYFSECSSEAEGSYTCTCSSGYGAVATNANQCEDIDECVVHSDTACAGTGTCVNIEASYTCECDAGYTGGEGAPCTDINECDEGTDDCGVTGTCENKDRGYTCLCNTGYEGGDTAACTNIDECHSGTHSCDVNANCTDTEASYTCTCRMGYVGDGNSCVDINECEEGTDNCDSENGECENNKGSFTCACKPGFMGTGYSDDCEDVATCTTFDKVKAAVEAVRTDLASESDLEVIQQYLDAGRSVPGVSGASYLARYNSSGEGVEQAIADVIGELRCDYFSTCSATDTDGTTAYSCECNDGYQDHETKANQCVDVNECSADPAPCHAELGTCTNSEGSHECECVTGYDGDGVTCDDIEECDDADLNTCDKSHGNCTNTAGFYECSCVTGYMGSGQSRNCTDVTTCATFDSLKSAIDVLQSEDSIENKQNLARQLLQEYATAEGRAVGVVQNAYRLRYVGAIAAEVEATLDLLRCDYFAACSAETDSCTCMDGYEEDTENGGCKDVDECSGTVELHGCHKNATCFNTEGSHTCTCNDGYFGNGTSCSDHNECLNEGDGHDCDLMAHCENFDGGHTCTCNSSYFGDGSVGNCEDITTCDAFNKVKSAIDVVQNADTSTEEAMADARKTLREYHEAKAAVTGVSGASYRQQFDGTLDEDIENVINWLICDYHSTCDSSTGNTTCSCNEGYFSGEAANTCLYVQTCTAFDRVKSAITTARETTDPNEMMSAEAIITAFADVGGHAPAAGSSAYTARYGDHSSTADVQSALDLLPCDYFSECSGDLVCTCIDGYETAEAANTCKDSDECFNEMNNDCHADAACTNTEGSFGCSCNDGFAGNGTDCADVVDCDSPDSDLCGANAVCTETPGSYSCDCKENYYGDGQVCVAKVSCLFSKDSDAGASCDDFAHPLSCHFKTRSPDRAEANFNFFQSRFQPPSEFSVEDGANRTSSDFSAMSSSTGDSFCLEKTTYDSPNKAYTDVEQTTEVELFSYDCHRQWFIKTECQASPTNIKLQCNTVSTSQQALVIARDDATGKYLLTLTQVFIPSSCKLQPNFA